jgi:hypothetical protein
MLVISEIYLMKLSAKEGTFSVKFVAGTADFVINEIKLDLNNSIEPISYYKVNGSQLLSGSYFDVLKRMLMKIFYKQTMSESIGLFKWTSLGRVVEKV